MKEYDFAGTVVAVTGAGHGFGRAIAQSFAALGAQVFATDLSAAELEETADHPGAIHTSAFDLTAPGAAKSWIADIEKHAEAPVGVLVSNAGGVHGLPEENEDIRVQVLSADELFAKLARGELRNALTLIAALWFQQHRDRLRALWR